MRSLPPAALAGALLAREGTPERQLVARLEWLQAWALREAAGERDEQCAMLAAACAHNQAQLAASARESLAAPDSSASAAVGGVQLHLPACRGIHVRGVGGLLL